MCGYVNCVNFVCGFNLLILVFGGGGYIMCNVVCIWVYEMGCLVGVEMD